MAGDEVTFLMSELPPTQAKIIQSVSLRVLFIWNVIGSSSDLALEGNSLSQRMLPYVGPGFRGCDGGSLGGVQSRNLVLKD